MISKTRYCKIGSGDVVLWNGSPRYVLSGPADNGARPDSHGSLLYVKFPIHRRSWTGRAATLYGWSDAKHALTIPRRKLSPVSICAAEKSTLESMGFNWKAELAREVREHEALASRIATRDPALAAAMRRETGYRKAKARLARLTL